jgi:hypothetical protein
MIPVLKVGWQPGKSVAMPIIDGYRGLSLPISRSNFYPRRAQSMPMCRPTAMEPAGDTIWIAERGAGKAVSIPMPR